MSPRVRSGRFGAELDGEFVVFLIGMRINKPWKVSQWWPAFTAMPRMLQELDKAGDRGLLAWRLAFTGPLSVEVIQYWRSYDQLEDYARDPGWSHLPAWKAFRKATGDDGDVGIWHETYIVADGNHEAIYVNMPVRGLASAGQPVGLGSSSRSRERIGG